MNPEDFRPDLDIQEEYSESDLDDLDSFKEPVFDEEYEEDPDIPF